MATDLDALVAKVQKLEPRALFTMCAQLVAIGREDVAEMIGQVALDKLAAKRLGLVK